MQDPLNESVDKTKQIGSSLAELRYKTLFEMAPFAILILDGESRKIIEFNGFALEMLGYSREEFGEMRLDDLETIETPAEIWAHIEKIKNTGKDEFETCWRTRSGELIDILVTATTTELDGKRVIHIIARDITAKKKQKEALILSEEKFAKVYKASPDSNLITRLADGRIIEVNDGFERNMGYRRQEVIGKTTLELNFWSDPDFRRRLVEKLKRDGYVRDWEAVFIARSGEEKTCLVSGELIQIQGEQFLVSVVKDISELKRAEMAVREREARLSALFDSAPVGIAQLDPLGHPIARNPAFKRMLGYSPEEMSTMVFTDFTHPEDVERDTRAFLGLVNGVSDSYQLEKRYIHKNGNVVWANLKAGIVRGESGEPLFIFSIVEDITEKKKAEQELRDALSRIEQMKKQLEKENIYLQEEIKLSHNFDQIVGKSDAIISMLWHVEKVATSKTTVLIQGETGTGKELIAHAIHGLSDRKNRPLVKLNCAAVPASLIESELFGHEKGAFTGAYRQKHGHFELADGGTIFLDEIGELPLGLQMKLLNFLQEGTFQRVGSPRTHEVDVRVIAATNRELQEMVQDGLFRSDLFFRLNVFPINVPPLRDRLEDIPLLVNHFIRKYCSVIGKKPLSVLNEDMETLRKYHWPGNIRELENIIERSVIISSGDQLSLGNWAPLEESLPDDAILSFDEMNRRYLRKVLDHANWRVSGPGGAAELLSLNPQTLYSKLKRYGLRE